MKRSMKIVPAICSLFLVAAPAWAEDPSNAALKAEIEVLKSRLQQLEKQVSSSEFKGISGIGEKPGASTLELPSGLQGLAISGYVDVSAIYNFAESDPGVGRTNRGRVFDTEPEGFTPHAAELVLEKPIADDAPIGFRTDLFFGDDAELIHSTGLGATVPNGDISDHFDLQQAYVTVRAPLGNGLDFKVGKFVTLLGAEVIESPANWNFSRSYLFGYAIPFTHTGALATYGFGELGSVTGGVVNGWDNVDDNNKGKSLLGNVTLIPMQGVTLAANGITGPEQTDNNRDNRTVIDLVGTWQPLEALTLMANYDYGHEDAGRSTSFDAKNWTGVALYAKYALTSKWALAGRWEWFDDKNNFRTALTGRDGSAPASIDFFGYTFTSQWQLYEHVLARLEYRHDQAGERILFHDSNSLQNYQDTVAAELIYQF